MNAKYKLVRAELDRVYNEELDSIYKLKRDEQLKLQAETSQLQLVDKYQTDIEKTAHEILEQTGSFDFITRSDAFLAYNQLKPFTQR